MRRNLWNEMFSRKQFPPFNCPQCETGIMVCEPASVMVIEPRYSKSARGHDDWSPDWVEERFSAMMQCNQTKCGEVAVMSGQTVVVEVVDDEHGWVYEQMLQPKAVFPGLPIIKLDEELPDLIKQEVLSAFRLFWSDLGSCASRLRASVERVLDDYKIPSSKAGGGFLNLNDRIKEFKKIDPNHGETFDALRYVGNIGAHADTLKREAVLDAFEIYEDALDELFAKKKHKARIDALKKKIIAAKGDYK